jgi:hypothetical protein
LQIVILDEPVSSQLFVDELLAAPEESALEECVGICVGITEVEQVARGADCWLCRSFYLTLGAHRLSKLVAEDWREQGPYRDQAAVRQIVPKQVRTMHPDKALCLCSWL